MQDENTTKVVFSSRLRAAMERNGLTQAELAGSIGLSQAAISKWLKGSIPSGDQLLKAGQRLGVSMEWLLGVDGDSPVAPSHISPSIVQKARHEAERLARQLADLEDTASRLRQYLGAF